ncbi:hypothetical protein PPERSA_03190 [Pseudocohnilembus persalinus]|uniref:SKP1 component POZ domain-containing protein n=1 Tax=Pseudocohnilembus persalinus TaxID=266149 RepID=A0A0V0QE22_PSEPJ|nr:hypothetical protein PPERSA_03190 [Pseudocohnilembus persalinus]|eukprot:KRX00457.1 hypothetical protein PPERSA_03190 [Pseudocohnilembus persalinus]
MEADSDQEIKLRDYIDVIIGPQKDQKTYKVKLYHQDNKERCKIKYIDQLLQQQFQETQLNNVIIESIRPKTFEWVLNYMDKHNWDPIAPETPIKSPILQQNLGKIDYQLFSQINIEETDTNEETQPTHLKNLYHAAEKLQIFPLKAAIIVTFATNIFVDNNDQTFVNIKKKYNIGDISIEDETRIQKWYNFND